MPIGSGPLGAGFPLRASPGAEGIHQTGLVFVKRANLLLKQTSRIGRPMSAYDDFSIALGGFRLAPL